LTKFNQAVSGKIAAHQPTRARPVRPSPASGHRPEQLIPAPNANVQETTVQ